MTFDCTQFLPKWYILFMQKIKVEQHTMSGGLWFAGWMFTIGILDLDFWQGLLGLVIWPYYIGRALTALL